MAECIRCGIDLDRHLEVTDEHVFGKWLSRRADNPRVAMSYGRRFYGSIRVPACKDCNGGDMATIDKAVAVAFQGQDPTGIVTLAEAIWGAWCSKVMYGLLANELAHRGVGITTQLQLPPPLAAARDLALVYRELFRGCLDGAVEPRSFSVVAFRTQHDRQERDVTAFISDESFGTLLVQVLGVLAFVSVRDGGYCTHLTSEYIDAARTLQLNPIQVIEIYCRYVDSLNARHEHREVRVLRTPGGVVVRAEGRNIPGSPVTGFLSSLLRKRLEPLGFASADIHDPPQTWLLDEYGRPRHLPLNATRNNSPRRTGYPSNPKRRAPRL